MRDENAALVERELAGVYTALPDHLIERLLDAARAEERTKMVKPYPRQPHADIGGVKVGDELWVRAVATDPCTSCCAVRIGTIHKDSIGSYIKPGDVRIITSGED